MSIGGIGTGPTLPDTADMGTQIAELVLASSSDEAKEANVVRDGEDQVEDQAEQEQVSSLHAKADTERAGANWSMVGGIVEGAADVGGGALELGGGDGAKWAKVAKGGGAIGGAVANREAAGKKADGTDDDATAAQFEHQAGAARRAADDARDDAKQARAMGDKALEFLRGFESTSAQTAAAALHRA